MPASIQADRGRGPGVVLLHGVGVGPGSFAPLVEQLCDRHRVVVLERPGAPGEASDLAAHADRIADVVAAHVGDGARLVGVSGGATLGLVLAERHPDLFASYVLHEPLLGRLAPALHHRFQAAAASAAEDEQAAMAVVAAVMGPDTWSALGPEGRSMARNAASTISDRTRFRCSRQRSLRASTLTPASPLVCGLTPRRTRSLYSP